MNNPRPVIAKSPLLRALFAIQDQRHMQNKELTERARLPRNTVTNLRRDLTTRVPVHVVERIAAALGCALVVQERTTE